MIVPKGEFYVGLLIKMYMKRDGFPVKHWTGRRDADLVGAVEEWCRLNLGVSYPDTEVPDLESMRMSIDDSSVEEMFGLRFRSAQK